MDLLVEQSCARFAGCWRPKSSVPGGGKRGGPGGGSGGGVVLHGGPVHLGKEIRRRRGRCAAIMEKPNPAPGAAGAGGRRRRALRPLAQAYAIPKEDPSRPPALGGHLGGLRRAGADGPPVRPGHRPAGRDAGKGQPVAAVRRGLRRTAVPGGHGERRPERIREHRRPWGWQAEALEAEMDRLLEAYLPKAGRIAQAVTARIRS